MSWLMGGGIFSLVVLAYYMSNASQNLSLYCSIMESDAQMDIFSLRLHILHVNLWWQMKVYILASPWIGPVFVMGKVAIIM